MKFIYILIVSSLFSLASAQSESISSSLTLLPVNRIPNIYADAPAPLNEMQVNDHLDFSAASTHHYKKEDASAQAIRARSYTTKKIKSYPKL